MATKKAKAAGKFGARYGKKLRVDYNKFYESAKTKYTCPNCSKEKSVIRLSWGVWECKNCKTKFASGAYEFTAQK
jgi:large subunit ribosomal protein L37Ae